MLIRHNGCSPQIDPAAWIAPNTVLCGDVTVGAGCRVMHGAQVIAEGGSITIGRECMSRFCGIAIPAYPAGNRPWAAQTKNIELVELVIRQSVTPFRLRSRAPLH